MDTLEKQECFVFDDKLLWIGIGLGLLYWFGESILHVLVFGEGDLASQILSRNPHEIWKRLLVAALIISFSVYAQMRMNERKQAETAITLAHNELDHIFQTASVGMRLIDRHFRVLKTNETLTALSGISTAHATGKKCYEGFSGPLCHQPSCPLNRILNGEAEVECEVVKVRRDGTRVHCLLTARPFIGPDGKLKGIVESFKDISELKRAQGDLLLERDKLRRILFQSFEGVGIVNNTYDIEYQNQSLHRQFGDCMGGKCYRVFRGREDPCDTCIMHEAVQTGMIRRYEFTTDTHRTYEQTYSPFAEADGREKAVVTLRDITEAKASRAAVYRSEQLAALGELAAGVAHEINNPINGILNYAQILINKHRSNPEISEIAVRVVRESDRVARIVESLLSFARRERQLKFPTSVEKILEDSLTLTAAQMRKDAIRIHLNVASGIPRIIAVPQEIQQVLINVLSNARYSLNQKYPKGQADKRIDIEAEPANLDGKFWVRISCRDQGLGIPANIIDKVMNPFFSTKPKGKGTGLGLSISHGIVSDHGGNLAIDGIPGEFARVTILLPAAYS